MNAQQAKGGSDRVEDLMKPRVKVIEPYPGSPHRVGDILHYDETTETFENPRNLKWIKDPSLYPANFKPLAWWEDRQASEMPEYVKRNERVWKVAWTDYLGSWNPVFTKDSTRLNQRLAIEWHYHTNEFLPATEADYNQYIQSQTNK